MLYIWNDILELGLCDTVDMRSDGWICMANTSYHMRGSRHFSQGVGGPASFSPEVESSTFSQGWGWGGRSNQTNIKMHIKWIKPTSFRNLQKFRGGGAGSRPLPTSGSAHVIMMHIMDMKIC